jgi:hypothetical protein
MVWRDPLATDVEEASHWQAHIIDTNLESGGEKEFLKSGNYRRLRRGGHPMIGWMIGFSGTLSETSACDLPGQFPLIERK